jgi:hypothetical protein
VSEHIPSIFVERHRGFLHSVQAVKLEFQAGHDHLVQHRFKFTAIIPLDFVQITLKVKKKKKGFLFTFDEGV